MPQHVLKFGGSSLADGEAFRAVSEIVKGFEDPVVVVSAVGIREKGEVKVTDLLLEVAEKALSGQSVEAERETLRARHAAILRELGCEETILDARFGELAEVCARGVTTEERVAFLDEVAAFGELLSSEMLAEFLRKEGAEAVACDAGEVGMVTDGEFGRARPLASSAEVMKEKIRAVTGIPVITGFIGRDETGRRTTLGRGGSDLTASLFAAALGAPEVRIYTDVPGIFSADPRVILAARPIPELSFLEAAELAYFGARVLHPDTLYPAISKGIPVRVLDTFRPGEPGTLITNKEKESLKSITWKKGITLVHVYSTHMLGAPGFFAKMFDVFARHKVSVDVVATSEVSVSCTVDASPSRECIQELSEFAKVGVESGFAIVCLVGGGITKMNGILGELFEAVGDSSLVEMVSQGASWRNITFLVREAEVEEVARRVFQKFLQR